jgi:ribonuclease R
VGDICPAVITGVTKFGLFVELDDVFVEGLVHVSTLVGDYFHFDPASQSLVGERTQTTYSLADVVSVQIASVDVDERKVDFELVSHSPLSSRRSKTKEIRKSKSKRNKKKKPKSTHGEAPKKRRRRR